jgi:hypothetical protein
MTAMVLDRAVLFSVRTGIIYALVRKDIKLIYVGQTINVKRIDRHFRGENYVLEEMTADGVLPEVEILSEHVALDDLDEYERRWMRTKIEDGWTLVNHLGPDASWPHVSPEYRTTPQQREGARRSRLAFHEARKSDPELDAWWRAVSASNMAALRARRLVDPEFDEKCRDGEARAHVLGAATRRLKRTTDPEWAEREREIARRGGLAGGRNGGKVTGAKRYQCVECGMTSTPGGIGVHQKSSGHKNKIFLVADAQDNSER